jgi:hypothetical protein
MRCHDDDVAVLLFGGADDGIVGEIAGDMDSFILHAGGCGFLAHFIEKFIGGGNAFAVEIVEGFNQHRSLVGIWRIFRHDVQSRHLRADILGKRDALFDDMLRCCRTIGRKKYVFEHVGLLASRTRKGIPASHGSSGL